MPESRRVLIVEDDQQISQLLVDALELEGFEQRAAANGRDALDILAGWRPHVIVLDLMMPVMDGWTFREEQRKQPDLRDIPVLLVSASRHLDTRTDQLMPNAVLAKPFELDALIETVARLAEDEALGSPR